MLWQKFTRKKIQVRCGQNLQAKYFRYAVAKNTTKPSIAFCALHVVNSFLDK